MLVLFEEDLYYLCLVLVIYFFNLITREDLVSECLQKGTELVQSIANDLFNLPSTEDRDGPLVRLPPPTTRLPREKPVRPHATLLSHLLLFQSI